MAKWDDLVDWRGPTPNQGGPMVEQRGVVLHIAQGSYEGTISWQKNPDADVSSHFIAAKDGRAAQMVDTGTTAWTQKAGNGKWLSIENEGFVPDKLTEEQCEFAAQILARAHKEYGVPLQVATSPSGRGLGHHSMGSHPGHADDWGHPDCPGSNIINQKSAIVARAKEIVEGDDMAFDDTDKKNLAATAERIEHLTNSWSTDVKTTWADNPAGTQPMYLVRKVNEALAQGKANAEALARIEAMLAAGVPVAPLVKLDPESVAAVAEATADEIHADPERDGT